MSAPPMMACQLCHMPLNTFGDPDAPRYLHPLSAHTDGHQPIPVPADSLDTLARRCDFCNHSYPLWTLTLGQVKVVAIGPGKRLANDYGARWDACAACESLASTGKVDALVDRAAKSMGWRHHPEGRQQIEVLYRTVLADRQPGRALITTTAWPATRHHPTDLPRIRDRLTQLYRSDDGLPAELNDQKQRRAIADSLDKAKLYWIDDDFTDLAQHAAAELPEAAIHTDDPPAEDGLLVWARPITNRQIAAATWAAAGDSHLLVCYRSIGGGLDGPDLERVRTQVGWLAPTHSVHVSPDRALPDGDHAAALLATWLLIAQKIGETESGHADRGTRKAYARRQRPIPEIRIVRVKGRATTGSSATGPAASGRKPMEERAWVGGHWKRQPHGPGRSQRKLIFVAPYLRGPDDKPIKLSTTVRILDNDGPRRPPEQHDEP